MAKATTPWYFFADDAGLLQLDFFRLFCAVPSEPSAEAVARAWARLACEAEDSVVAPGGVSRARQAGCFGPLREAVASLVGAGGRVSLETGMPLDDRPGLRAHPEGADVVVAGTWEWARLADVPHPATQYTADADEWPLPHDLAACPTGWVLRVRALNPPPRACAPPGPWCTVVATPSMHVRVWLEAHSPGTGSNSLGTSLYRAGVLWAEEDVPACALAGARLHVDVHGGVGTTAAGDHPWVGELPSPATGADALAQAVLVPEWAAELSQSACARALLRAALPWREELRSRWRGSRDAIVAALIDECVGPELSALMPAHILAEAAPSEPELSRLGLAALRRMAPESGTRLADWKASVVSEHAVAGFKLMPVTGARWAQLHALRARCPRRFLAETTHGRSRRRGGSRSVAGDRLAARGPPAGVAFGRAGQASGRGGAARGPDLQGGCGLV